VKLPAIHHLFRETEKIFEDNLLSVIKNGFPAEAAENLVLIGLQDEQVGIGMAIDDWPEIHLEAAIVAAELPGLQITVGGNVELYPVEFVDLAVETEQVFRGL